MQKIFNFIFERSWILEVSLRRFFEVIKPIKNIALKIFDNNKHKNQSKPVVQGQWENFKKCINNLDIQSGEIVLVHSSIKGLATLGVSANQIIDYLLERVGNEGTLVFPAYPDYELMKNGRINPYYDYRVSKPWTGKLPRTFLEYPEVERSLFPHNTLAAKGPLAKEMMKGNLQSVYSQGKNSAWDFCVQNNMKILYLGVQACTSCTIVHYPEDILAEDWPVNNWFEEENYDIWVDGKIIQKKIMTRRKFWFKFYKMFNTGYWMRKKGFLEEYDIDGVYIGFMSNSKGLCDELIKRAKDGKLLFAIPKKYRK